MVNMKVTKISANYDLSSVIPMTLRGIAFNPSRLSKARFIYPMTLPFAMSFTGDECIFKYYNEYESKIDQFGDLSVFAKIMLEYLKDNFDHIEFKSIQFDESAIPITAISKNEVVFSLFPKTYFDTGKYLIPSHITSLILDSEKDKSKFGVIKLGDKLISGFNYYTLNCILLPFLLSYLYSMYESPSSLDGEVINLESFQFLYAMVCSAFKYERLYVSSMTNYYNDLEATNSLPKAKDLNKLTRSFDNLKTELLKIKDLNKPAEKRQLALSNNTRDDDYDDDLYDDYWHRQCYKTREGYAATGNNAVTETKTVTKTKAIEHESPAWDVQELYELSNNGYFVNKDTPSYTYCPIDDFLNLAACEEVLDFGQDAEIIILLPQKVHLIDNDPKAVIIPQEDIIIGFYTQGVLTVIFDDSLESTPIRYSSLFDLFQEFYGEIFDVIEFYTEQEVKGDGGKS